MTTTPVVTVMGTDRPGLVEALSRALAAHRATGWRAASRVSAAVSRGLLTSVPETEARVLKEALATLESEGLRITVEDSGPERGPASRGRSSSS